MKTRRLVRGQVTPRRLGEVLDELGVKAGEEFIVSSRTNYFPGDDASDNHTVRGKSEVSAAAATRAWPSSGSQRARIIEALVFLGPKAVRLDPRFGGQPASRHRPRVLEAIDGGWVRQADRGTIDGNELLEATEASTRRLVAA